MKTAIIIGFGGMGIRHFKALSKLNIKVKAICDKNLEKIEKDKSLKKIIKTNNYKKILNIKADIVCIASNTQSRFAITKNFLKYSKIQRILIEKPLSVTFKDSLELYNLVKKNRNRRIYVNTFRTISKNFENVKKVFTKNKEKITHIFINSPSAGLGNMGSIFFDLGNYFIEENAVSVTSWIDKTGTVSPRGKIFKDPGGYGIVRYKNEKKLFFDLSEDTSLPYEIILKSRNFECKIDELNNNFSFRKRPNKYRVKPNYYYLYKPEKFNLKIAHKYDVVKMTTFSIKKLFEKKFQSNLQESIKSMELVFAAHASDNKQETIKLPLSKKFHNKKVNFA
tara:strand:+ start:6343 stop:7353 length:1011 start_codon:yes stop_codon:yes gene_type:complete